MCNTYLVIIERSDSWPAMHTGNKNNNINNNNSVTHMVVCELNDKIFEREKNFGKRFFFFFSRRIQLSTRDKRPVEITPPPPQPPPPPPARGATTGSFWCNNITITITARVYRCSGGGAGAARVFSRVSRTEQQFYNDVLHIIFTPVRNGFVAGRTRTDGAVCGRRE